MNEFIYIHCFRLRRVTKMKRSKLKIRVTRCVWGARIYGLPAYLQTQLVTTHACEILDHGYTGLHYSKARISLAAWRNRASGLAVHH